MSSSTSSSDGRGTAVRPLESLERLDGTGGSVRPAANEPAPASVSPVRTNPWRRFFALAAGTAAAAIAIIWLFVVLVDPFDALPLSPSADRVPVASNARY